MQGAAEETAPRQMAVDDGKAQGDSLGRTEIPLHPGQQAAQFLGNGGAIAHHGKGTGLGHDRLCPDTRTKQEQSQGSAVELFYAR
jgi:hypothetical protein